MRGQNGVQMQVSQKMIEFKKQVKNDRIANGKESSGDLSDKRLSITFVKILSLPQNYLLLINADIDKNAQ
jgi:hypothetical protein